MVINVMDHFKKLIMFSVALAAIILPLGANCGSNSIPNASERKLLPDFCQARWGGDKALYKSWQARMGRKNWAPISHYCHGINYLNKASLSFEDKAERKHYLNRSINNFEYAMGRWDPSFPLYKRAKSYVERAKYMKRTLRHSR